MTKNKIIDKCFDLLELKLEYRTIGGEAFRRANLLYESVKHEMLRTKKFDFSITEEKLKPIGKGYWEYPNALWLMRAFIDDGFTDHQLVCYEEKYDFELKRRIIYCPYSNVRMEFIKRDVKESEFSDDFIEVFSLALAADLCIWLTGNITKQQELTHKLYLKLGELREHWWNE